MAGIVCNLKHINLFYHVTGLAATACYMRERDLCSVIMRVRASGGHLH